MLREKLSFCQPGQHADGTWLSQPVTWENEWDCCGHEDSSYHGINREWIKRMGRCRQHPLNFTDDPKRDPVTHGPFCCTRKLTDATWVPRSCRLHDWSSHHFCGALANRSILLAGDSTMEQFASSLMSALHGTDCERQIIYGGSDFLVHASPGYAERGHSRLTWVERYKPDLVVLSTGAHQFENMSGTNKWKPKYHYFNASRYNATLQEIFDTALQKLPGRVIWKTTNAGGCARHPSAHGMLNASPAVDSNYDAEDTESVRSFFPDLDRNVYTKFQYSYFPVMDHIARAQAARTGVAVLDAAPLYQRLDAHVGSLSRYPNDCLHFCLNTNGPISLLNVLLHHVLLYGRRHGNSTPPARLAPERANSTPALHHVPSSGLR